MEQEIGGQAAKRSEEAREGMMAKTARRKNSGRIWCVTLRYVGTETHVADIPTTHIGEERLKDLMRMIYAKYILSDDEIVRCFLKGAVKKHRDLLTVHEYRFKTRSVL